MNFISYLKRFTLASLLFAGHLLSAKADTVDNYQIFIKGKLILTERDFNPLSSTIKFLKLDSTNYGDTIAINFNHCTAGASNRIIRLKDAKGNMLIEWDFPDKDSIKVMKIPIKNILENKQVDTKILLSLHYYDNQLLPTGVLLAPVHVDKVFLQKKKSEEKSTYNNSTFLTENTALVLLIGIVIRRRESTNRQQQVWRKTG